MAQSLYPEIDRVIPTESGLVRGVAGGTPQYTVYSRASPTRRPLWEICAGKSPSLWSLWKAFGTPSALALSLPSTETLRAPSTAMSFSAAPNP